MGSPAPDDAKLRLLARVLADGGSVAFRRQASELGIPLSTAYRMLGSLSGTGLVMPGPRGTVLPGYALVEMASTHNPHRLLAEAARPEVRRTARRARATLHLGILESEMVTYLVKERGGGPPILTSSGIQFEAYCTGIGKMLLAGLPETEQARYLANGPFVPLTDQTITDPGLLRDELRAVRARDYAYDEREFSDLLRCVAVPLRNRTGDIVAAVSLSRPIGARGRLTDDDAIAELRDCAARIAARLWPQNLPMPGGSGLS